MIKTDCPYWSFQSWPADEAAKLQATARRLFSKHDYQHQGVDVDNCGLCALTHGGTGPNCAGWDRVYVEDGHHIPRRWQVAFDRELASDNRAYAGALRRSIATFGEPKFESES
jgi:hypothetical protein